MPLRIACSQCGQELIGAVNRCWRCGASLPAVLDHDGLPKRRRAPVERRAAAVEADAQEAAVVVAALAAPPVREAAAPPTAGDPSTAIPAWREWAAAIGVVLGLAGAVAWQLQVWPVLLGLLAVGGGLWGVGTPRQAVAMAAILLGCLVLAIAAGGLALSVFEQFYGALPWQP